MSDTIIYPILTERHVPSFVRDSRFMKQVFAVEDKMLTRELYDINFILRTGYVDSMEDPLLSFWEQWWEIAVPKQATIEDRRLAVKTKFASRTLYTKRSLARMLDALCGQDGYELTIDTAGFAVRVKLELKTKNQIGAVLDMFHDVLPANMIYEATIRYNQHKTYQPYKHSDLAAHTHKGLREDVLE